MATASFSTSVLIFVTLWLYGLTAFGIIVCAVFLHILGAVDGTIGSSVAVSIISVTRVYQLPGKGLTHALGRLHFRSSRPPKRERLSPPTTPLAQVLAFLDLRTAAPCLNCLLDCDNHDRSGGGSSTTTVQKWGC